ncbi:MAG: sigma-70 family RNA polymerase sigma factor [Phycisphaerales bacterium]|nr:sigma-70 family RNA polymerase sigma factor [Phycisphaerales bacterium]
MPADDRTLLRKTHGGHEPSARELWQRHAGWMLAYAGSLLPRGSGAEDVVQNAFCRLLELDRRTVRQVREVRPWLAQLVRRLALNQLRSARRAGERDRRALPPSPILTGPHAHPELGAALTALPRRLREVVHLRHVAGLTTDQTALALGIPRGTVASRHHAAMESLRALLEPAQSGTITTGIPTGGSVHAHAV